MSLRDVRERAITKQQKLNDPKHDGNWLHDMQESISKLIRKKAAQCIGTQVVIPIDNTTPQRRLQYLDEWLDDLELQHTFNGNDLAIWLDLPELDPDTNARLSGEMERNSVEFRSSTPTTPITDRQSNTQITERNSPVTPAKINGYVPNLERTQSDTINTWTAKDQKWLEDTRMYVAAKFAEDELDKMRNWCHIVIKNTSTERNRRLLSWLNDLGLSECTLTSSCISDECFHVCCNKDESFQRAINELYKF